jgi:hypothetical protein
MVFSLPRTVLRELNGTTINGAASWLSFVSGVFTCSAEFPGLMSSKVPVQSDGMMRSIVGHGYTLKQKQVSSGEIDTQQKSRRSRTQCNGMWDYTLTITYEIVYNLHAEEIADAWIKFDSGAMVYNQVALTCGVVAKWRSSALIIERWFRIVRPGKNQALDQFCTKMLSPICRKIKIGVARGEIPSPFNVVADLDFAAVAGDGKSADARKVDVGDVDWGYEPNEYWKRGNYDSEDGQKQE